MGHPSLVEMLQSARHRDPGRIALQFEDQSWTYAELYRTVDSLAAGLKARGIRGGDRIAFLLPNEPELIFLNLACLKLGAIAVPLNTRLKGAELAYNLGHSRARLCVVHPDFYPSLQPVASELQYIEHLFVVGSAPPAGGCEVFAELLDHSNEEGTWPERGSGEAAAILYTSGTTARPKGVTHTHGSLSATVRNYAATVGLTSADVVFGMLSMSHIFGYTLQLLSPLSVGATVLVAGSFDPPRVMHLIAAHRASHLYGLPIMFEALTREPPRDWSELRNLRYCLAGGDSVSPRLSAGVRTALGVELHEGCGMTEVIPYALNRPGLQNRVGSIGRPSVGMHLRLADDEGQDPGIDEVGEILVQSEGLMAGYWEDPAATAAVLQEGWFRTGDIGRRDAAGYYWFVGRSKEIIVRGGSNIAPLEVEAVLAQHPAVQEAVVVGIPHPSLGESVAAFVVLKKGTTTTAPELQQFAADRIAAYKVPVEVTFLDDLPRGLTGKVHRKTLKERAAQSAAHQLS